MTSRKRTGQSRSAPFCWLTGGVAKQPVTELHLQLPRGDRVGLYAPKTTRMRTGQPLRPSVNAVTKLTSFPRNVVMKLKTLPKPASAVKTKSIDATLRRKQDDVANRL